MKRLIVLLTLVVLAACVPEYEPPVTKEPQRVISETATERAPIEIPIPRYKVWQKQVNNVLEWGYDENRRLIVVNDSSRAVVFNYEKDKLVGIDVGNEPLQFFYDKSGKLLSAERGQRRWIFTYSSTGNLLSLEARERLRFTYDTSGYLSSVIRDGGPRTEFVYDREGRTESMYFSDFETKMRYDERSRLKLMNREDDFLVIAYWREDLLSSLSGTLYGLKETVNYGPESIKLVSNVDEQEFRSQFPEDKDLRMDAFNTFLFCTRFKKLPVTFDGQSWIMYREYMKGSLVDYLKKTLICEYL